MQLSLEDGGLGDDPPRKNQYVETLTREQVMMRNAEDHEWKMNGLALHLLAMPKTKRVGWLEGFLKEHGAEITDDLKSRLLKLHEARKSSRHDA